RRHTRFSRDWSSDVCSSDLTTGTVVMRWDGARQPVIWCVPPPEIDPRAARLELVRRYLQVFGPATPETVARWAGIRPPGATAARSEERRVGKEGWWRSRGSP